MLELICTRTCGTCRKAVDLLEKRGIEYSYRDYREDPLTEEELGRLLERLGLPARAVLRPRDKAFKTLGLTGRESDETLIPLMAEHPTLLQRPIGVSGDRAVLGRPPKRLLELV